MQVQPAVHPEDDAPPVVRQPVPCASRPTSSGRCATSASISSTASRWRSSGRTGRARARSSRCSPGSSLPSRASVEVDGHDLQPADARRGVRPGADRAREHPPGRARSSGIERGRWKRRIAPGSSSSPTSARSSTPRSRPTRRACAPGSGSRSRPSVDPDILLLDEVLATGDEVVPGEVEGARAGPGQAGEGGRPRDPRHELGDRVLQPGDPAPEGPHRRRGRPGRGRGDPPGALERSKAEREAAIARAMAEAGHGPLPPDAARGRLPG